MKHPTLYRFLLTFACALACVYAYFLVVGLTSDDPRFPLIACAALVIPLLLVDRIRNAYTRTVWMPTLLSVISAVISFDVGWRWPLTHTVWEIPSFVISALWWAAVIVHVFVSVALVFGGAWFGLQLLRWWRLDRRSGFDTFVDMLHHGAVGYVKPYTRAFRATLLGALIGLVSGFMLGWVGAQLPVGALLIPYAGDVLRFAGGGAFGYWIATRHIEHAAWLRMRRRSARRDARPLAYS
jgi:hypothetical protein